MMGKALKSFIREREGNALPSVLIIITLISLLAGLVMAGTVLQSRFIRKDIHALKARYAAESAIFQFLAENRLQKVDSLRVPLPDSSSAVISAAPFGGFYRIDSEAEYRGERKRVRVLIGERKPDIFDRAIVLGDLHSELHLTGTTRIAGDIGTGPLGVARSAFKGALFSGEFRGRNQRESRSQLPDFDSSLLDRSMGEMEQALVSPSRNAGMLEPGEYDWSELMARGGGYFYSSGDLTIRGSIDDEDGDLPEVPVTIAAGGNLNLEGSYRFPMYSRFMAGDTLRISGQLEGRHGLFYGKGKVSVRGDVDCSGQFLSSGAVEVSDRSYLRYPSVLYLQPSDRDLHRDAEISIGGESVVDGMAIIPFRDAIRDSDRMIISIGSEATLRGAVYNSGQTELHGRVLGSVLTFQFGFYHSPTRYVNWLKDAEVLLPERPERFTVPVGFSEEPEYEMVAWEEIL